MPTITLQVGQCGNQLGEELWGIFGSSCCGRYASNSSHSHQYPYIPTGISHRGAGSLLLSGPSALQSYEDSAFFRRSSSGHRLARCVLVDTEPKVVNAVLAADTSKFFQRSSCFLGQSGRGNNWAYGYSSNVDRIATPQTSDSSPSQPASDQGAAAIRRSTSYNSSPDRRTSERGSARPSSAAPAAWRVDAHVQDPSGVEFRMIEDVFDGIRKEAEHCDTAPDFLMLHSLGGGSGSGMGSRMAEHLREEHPRNILASAAIAPGGGPGDAAMQGINSVLALSFLQAYADVIMLFSNSDWMAGNGGSGGSSGASGTAGGGGGGAAAGVRRRSIRDMNEDIAACIAGAVWPLSSRDACGGTSRLRDMVCNVAPDGALKMVEVRTAWVQANTPIAAIWPTAARAVASLFPRPAATTYPGLPRPDMSGSLLLARGFTEPHDTGVASFIKACGGRGSFVDQDLPDCGVQLRCGTATLSHDTSPGISSKRVAGARGTPSLTAVSNRSNCISTISAAAERVVRTVEAGAYMHWYEKYGCSRDAISYAAEQLQDVADSYRLLHGHTG
ncbi:MAG: hypothetical protein WDW36_002621 [Sanguina aurantia]